MEQAFGGQGARRSDNDMLVEVDLSSIIADMEDGERVVTAFMDTVST